jgi:hypothetical protein
MMPGRYVNKDISSKNLLDGGKRQSERKRDDGNKMSKKVKKLLKA